MTKRSLVCILCILAIIGACSAGLLWAKVASEPRLTAAQERRLAIKLIRLLRVSPEYEAAKTDFDAELKADTPVGYVVTQGSDGFRLVKEKAGKQ